MNSKEVIMLGSIVKRPVTMDKGYVVAQGEVVYIHPKKRFYTVEFRFPKGLVRESYCFYGPLADGGRWMSNSEKGPETSVSEKECA